LKTCPKFYAPHQGRRQKNIRGGGGQRKKVRKIAKKYKNSTIKAFSGGGGQRKKDRKIVKKDKK